MEAAIRRIGDRIADQEIASKTNITPQSNDPTAPRGPIKLTFLQVGNVAKGDPAGGDRQSGSHVAQVEVELHDAMYRNVTRAELISMWREEAGVFPARSELPFRPKMSGQGGSQLSSRF